MLGQQGVGLGDSGRLERPIAMLNEGIGQQLAQTAVRTDQQHRWLRPATPIRRMIIPRLMRAARVEGEAALGALLRKLLHLGSNPTDLLCIRELPVAIINHTERDRDNREKARNALAINPLEIAA